MADACFLIGDIGGTNARFALAGPNGAVYAEELTFKCADYETADLAITDYLERTGAPDPDVICLAAAGPVVDDCVSLTNNHWRINSRALHASYPSARVHLMNDFEAVAHSIPLLGEADLTTIGPPLPGNRDKTNLTVGVLGPGTGFGIAGLIVRQGNFYPIVGEGSDAGFAPENDIQLQLLLQLRERFERVTDEHLVSGPGLENIYRAVCRIRGVRRTRLAAPDIFKRVMANTDEYATEALQLFYEILGQVAGNLALLLGAYDGIYIAGGIIKRHPTLLKASNFRLGFENKGRYYALMKSIPTQLILHPQPGLLGASHCALQM